MKRFEILIKGIVQGVGFRPFVKRLAKELGIKGYILNTSNGVLLDVELEDLDLFLELLKDKKPPLSEIYSISVRELSPIYFNDFTIKPSKEDDIKLPSIPPDMGICEDCIKEFYNNKNRRYKYPFINCTNCGPRYSIITNTPYDRKNTTMNVFKMCDECNAEYQNISDKRFHAETNCCKDCGPEISYFKDGEFYKENVFEILKKDLKDGKIIAIKGLGGFHLICNAIDDDIVKTLRERKKRSSKPFAVMFKSIEDISNYTHLSEFDKRLLTSIEKPIVLVKRKKEYFNEACKGLSHVGAFLPYTGIHMRILDDIDFPIIATSGNISDSPICKDNEETIWKLGNVADGFLLHNRDIARPIDDSVIKPLDEDRLVIRYARSFAPRPFYINKNAKAISLGIGAFKKSSIAFYKDNFMVLSQHIGDLDSVESFEYYKSTLEEFLRFYNINPDVVVADMHPNFPNTSYAKERFKNIIYLQHHKAHIYSCIAENNVEGEMLGIAWDGVGYGEDGTIWGGEFFLGDDKSLKRVFHIKPYKLIGLDKASKEPSRILYSFLFEMFEDYKDVLNYLNINDKNIDIYFKMWKEDINTIPTSSVGRLFDMVGYLSGLVDYIDYESKGAMMVEDAYIDTKEYYDFEIKKDHIDIRPMVYQMIREKDKTLMPSKFINTLFEIIKHIIIFLKAKNVCVSGGVFYNKILMLKLKEYCQKNNLNFYYNKRFPIGDGGISVGQAYYGGVLC